MNRHQKFEAFKFVQVPMTNVTPSILSSKITKPRKEEDFRIDSEFRCEDTHPLCGTLNWRGLNVGWPAP